MVLAAIFKPKANIIEENIPGVIIGPTWRKWVAETVATSLDDDRVWTTLCIGLATLILVPAWFLYRYRKSILKHLQSIEEDFSKGIMVREPRRNRTSYRSVYDSTVDRKDVYCLELNSAFVEAHQDWNLISLGEYLSGLHPCLPGTSDDRKSGSVLPKFIEHELEVTIGTFLVNALGRRVGGAVLPMLGITDVKSRTSRLAASVATWWASHFLAERAASIDPSLDSGTLPLDISELSSFANLNQKFAKSYMKVSPLQLMENGEVGYDPSFGQCITDPLSDQEDGDDKDQQTGTKASKGSCLIPNPFLLSEDWNKAIAGLERLILTNGTAKSIESKDPTDSTTTTADYDPDDRSLPEPTPINQRLLPDLFLGWGKAECSHTRREIIRNRLLCVLLNKLSYNYYKTEQRDDDLFVVKMKRSSNECIFPQQFIECLMGNGHAVEVCPRAQITTFGLGLCVSEEDGSWSHIPLACFARSGYESDVARPAHVMFPHGGIELSIKSGPLVGKNQRCDIQFYMAIEGLCGWHSNHNPLVPWLQNTASTGIYDKSQSLLAVKLAAILAVTFNGLGTSMDLPFGGYGVLGVCNDTAALLDYAVRGTTDMFPLVSTGRYLMHTARRLLLLLENFESLSGNHVGSLQGIRRLIAASCKIQSDLHASPSNVIDATNRLLAGQPKEMCFQLEIEGLQIMTNLKNKFEQYRDELDKRYPGLD